MAEENIFHKYQHYTIVFVLVFSVAGLTLDTIQQLGLIKEWLIRGGSTFLLTETGSRLNLAVLNILTIFVFLTLLFFLFFNSRGNVQLVSVFFVVTLSANTFTAYFWYFSDASILSANILRDLILFFILIFVSATCINTLFTVAITAVAWVFYLLFSILAGDVFLIENIPVAIMLTGSFAFVFRKIVIILKKSIRKQEEEARRVKELSQFKERMSHMLLHDIKVPLNSINMLSHPPLSTSNFKKINDQVLRVSRMLGNIIDVESGNILKIRLKKIPFPLSAWIIEALEQVHYLALSKNIRLQTELPDVDPKIPGDKDLLERCLINIIENAVKYSPANSSVLISSRMEENVLHISVSDKGPGIKPEDQEKIFELFYTIRAHAGNERSSGMGLTFCKLVMEAHNGHIAVESKPEGGATFSLTLPLSSENLIRTFINKGNNPVQLSKETRRLLRPIGKKLTNIACYQSSDIVSILNTIPLNEDKQVREEIEKFKELALSCNQKLYSSLLKMIQ
ncbi:MAG: HAMP domain-containing histidine kinase [Bacteroidales bacterium]|nr:HAMP domain-containing histidine kinase [Bacteroidales bacterium]